MGAKKTLEYIASIENDSYLGILEKVNLNQRPPIEFPNMTRKHLSRLFRKLGFRIGAEIGVETGLFSECLCKCNPGAKLYSIDAWKAYRGYRDHVNQEKLDRFYEETKKRMASYNCEIIRAFSMDAVKGFENGSLDFVHIDGNHEFQQFTNDIAEWSKKVRKGGIVSGHDFKRFKGNYICHVKDVVQAWTYAHGIKPWFVLREGGKRNPSWFWVRE